MQLYINYYDSFIIHGKIIHLKLKLVENKNNRVICNSFDLKKYRERILNNIFNDSITYYKNIIKIFESLYICLYYISFLNFNYWFYLNNYLPEFKNTAYFYFTINNLLILWKPAVTNVLIVKINLFA